MASEEWVRGPFGLDASKGETLVGTHTVLAVVHHLTAATRLNDVLPILEEDRRIQVVFTVPPSSVFERSGIEAAHASGGIVIPWQQARQHRFDLALAAGHGLLQDLHAPVMVFPHGVGGGTYPSRWAGFGAEVARQPIGSEPARYLYRGRVIPTVIVLGSDRQRRRLMRTVPEAAPATLVAGDPCLDRMLASLGHRDAYRRAFGVAPGQRLVVVSSTWSTHSSFGRHRDLLPRLMAELPTEDYRVVAALHPNIWSWHGRRQVRSWHADSIRRGLFLVPPEEGWRAALVAADLVIGDHGSVTTYAAALGRPVLLASHPRLELDPHSVAAEVARLSPHITSGVALPRQVEAAIAEDVTGVYDQVRGEVSSQVGASAAILRRAMYGLLKLEEPKHDALPSPVPLPMAHSGHPLGASK